jgi:hypothetical protein
MRSNHLVNRTENASVFSRKAKSKLRWWPNLRVAAGYHEPLGEPLITASMYRRY